METIYLVTHIPIGFCIMIILYLSVNSTETNFWEQKISVIYQIYVQGLKFVKLLETISCRIAAAILVAYLK